MGKRLLFCLLIISLSLVSCGQGKSGSQVIHFKPNTIGNYFQDYDEYWVLCNIYGDGVVRKVVFYEQDDKSFFAVRKPNKDENDLLLGPKALLAKDGLIPTLVDLTGDRVPEIVWPTSFHQANSLAVISILGGPIKYYIEDVVLSCSIHGVVGNERIWLARPDDVTTGSVEMPYSYKNGRLLPDPFLGGESMEFSATKTGNDFEKLGALWAKFFLGRFKPKDEETRDDFIKSKNQFSESAKKLHAYIAWNTNRDQSEGDLIFLNALQEGLTNESKTSLLFAHKAEFALWKGDFSLAREFISKSLEACPYEPPPVAIRMKSFLLENP